jgi:hypothetical protein
MDWWLSPRLPIACGWPFLGLFGRVLLLGWPVLYAFLAGFLWLCHGCCCRFQLLCLVYCYSVLCWFAKVDLQLLCAVILFSFWREVWSVGFLRPACWSLCSWILFRQACWDVSAVDVSLALPDCFAVCPTGFCCWLLFEVLFLLPEAANALGGLPSCLKLVVGAGLRSSPMVLPLLLVGFVGSGCCWVLYDPVFAGLLLLRLLVAALYPPGGFCSLYFHFEFAAFWRCK